MYNKKKFNKLSARVKFLHFFPVKSALLQPLHYVWFNNGIGGNTNF